MAKVLEFFDVKSKKKFKTSKYVVTKVNGRKAAKAKAPSGVMAFRFLPKDFKR